MYAESAHAVLLVVTIVLGIVGPLVLLACCLVETD